MIMDERSIKKIIEDYTLRELQQYSSLILFNFDATNTFIKQFKSDHDSHQFYKNVIFWYINKFNVFPESILTFDFPLNDGGLGDRFVLTSNLLFTINSFSHVLNSQINLYVKLHQWQNPELEILANNFYDVIDFFHFKRPKHKILSHKINNSKPFEECERSIFKKNKIFNDHHKKYWESGTYWPMNVELKPKTIITFMFYLIDDDGTFIGHGGDEFKSITLKMLNEFEKIKNKFSNLNFVKLEDLNFAKNVELLSKSHFLISSEGMWTHLSRAMKIDTIAYTTTTEFEIEFNKQGHFCSGNFYKFLEEIETKCTSLAK
tara:strand:- start:233 stop:1186 length:954 start_codon:yes stop_codon:yes gene_type:complete